MGRSVLQSDFVNYSFKAKRRSDTEPNGVYLYFLSFSIVNLPEKTETQHHLLNQSFPSEEPLAGERT